MLELVAGVFVTFAALAVVLEPLFTPRAQLARDSEPDEIDVVDIEESESPKVQALLALKEIEFDRATGKLSDDDYEQLKAKYAAQAVEAMKAAGAPGAAEALVQRAKARKSVACPVCGPRPETNAVFCSTCGRPLAREQSRARCHGCGSALPDGAKFCAACGIKIAA